MPSYKVTLIDEERTTLQREIQKGDKGYRIKHAQILLKLNHIPENAEWTYKRTKAAYGSAHGTIASVAKRFAFEGVEAALCRKSRKIIIFS